MLWVVIILVSWKIQSTAIHLYSPELLFQMNKAGVLRKAIEVILKLQNDNARLKQENMTLKMAQQKRGMRVIVL